MFVLMVVGGCAESSAPKQSSTSNWYAQNIAASFLVYKNTITYIDGEKDSNEAAFVMLSNPAVQAPVYGGEVRINSTVIPYPGGSSDSGYDYQLNSSFGQNVPM